MCDEKTGKKMVPLEYVVPVRRSPIVKPGQQVVAGELLTDGSADHMKFSNTVEFVWHKNILFVKLQSL